MAELDKVINGLKCCTHAKAPIPCGDCSYFGNIEYNDAWSCRIAVMRDALELLKEQETIKPTINEYGEAYCICGENVGIIPNNKNLPSVLTKYCHECGRRMKWE